MLTIEKVRRAQEVLKEAAFNTDLIVAEKLGADCEMRLKLENLQRTGSFKLRGAYNKIANLTSEEKARGVIACSAGNHAQGVAYAAAKQGIKALICLPAGAPIAKIEATRSYGAEVCLVPGVYDDAFEHALKLKEQYGYTFVHPFDDEDVIAGQATVGAEIVDEWQDVEAIVVPVGGGGLLSGVAFAAKAIKPSVKVYGVQAAGAASMASSLKEGKIGRLSSVMTVADGIAVKEPGALTFEYCKDYSDGIVTVTEDEIALAILSLAEKQKLISEGAGATPVAAVLSGKIPELHGKKVCCLVSGGNIDVTTLSRVLQRGLFISGRQCELTLEVADKPGQLAPIVQIVADCGANVLSVEHDHAYDGQQIVGCFIRLELETSGFDHIERIKHRLRRAGLRIVPSRHRKEE